VKGCLVYIHKFKKDPSINEGAVVIFVKVPKKSQTKFIKKICLKHFVDLYPINIQYKFQKNPSINNQGVAIFVKVLKKVPESRKKIH